MYATTPEPDNPRYPQAQLAKAMRAKLEGVPAPQIQELAARITENDEVIYRPLETFFLQGAWHKGRIVLLGYAVHATTPHLGQGAGMAIEDAIVFADEISKTDRPQTAFQAYRDRRFKRCRYIVEASGASDPVVVEQLQLVGDQVARSVGAREHAVLPA